MPSFPLRFVAIGALAALIAVLLGAFGAHALRNRLAPDLLAVYHTGVEYHFYAAFGLIAIGLLGQQLGGQQAALVAWAGWLMLAGMLLFSGSLYVLALSGVRILGAVTPFGGVAFIAAWALFGLAAWRGST